MSIKLEVGAAHRAEPIESSTTTTLHLTIFVMYTVILDKYSVLYSSHFRVSYTTYWSGVNCSSEIWLYHYSSRDQCDTPAVTNHNALYK